jgi:hypothetical protein
VNEETRQALAFVLKEMGAERAKLEQKREQIAAELADLDAKIDEITRRARAIDADMAL